MYMAGAFIITVMTYGRLFEQADILLQSIRKELLKVSPQSERPVTVLYNTLKTSPNPQPEATILTQDGVQLEHTAIFYIGSESLGLTNLLMTNSAQQVRPKTLFCVSL